MHLKVYVAGKISAQSSFGTSNWRDAFCSQLSQKSGIIIENLDPAKTHIDHSNAELVYGRNSFLIQSADVVIVYLSDDISVGGSQEMLIAKHFSKPLLGLAPVGGKFNAPEKEVLGHVYQDFLDPYVAMTCDAVAHDIDELARLVQKCAKGEMAPPKSLSLIDESIEHYKKSNKNRV